MKTAMLLAVLLMPQELQATTLENRLFVCTGTLINEHGDYAIEDDFSDVDSRQVCFIDQDQKLVKQILKVCTVGKSCVVSAKGQSGNGNHHIIEKIFEVQTDHSLDELKAEKEQEIRRMEREQPHPKTN